MENLMLLQKQLIKPVKIALVIADALFAAFFILLWMLGEEVGLYLEMFGGLLVLLLFPHLLILEWRKPSASLYALPPDLLREINSQCLTGLRFGNGILCDNDCLVFVDRAVTAVRLQDVGRLVLTTAGKKRIDVLCGQGVFDADSGLPPAIQAIAAGENCSHSMINGSAHRVRGAGTFREADADAFWSALCSAWRKYSDAEPEIR